MQLYCNSLTQYSRLITREVNIGGLLLGNAHPIRLQTMTTTDTMDTIATIEQSIRCIEAGAELVRITAPSKNEAENLRNIKEGLRKRGYNTPIIADIHFTPNAAEIAARIIEKVRVNPGNYVDKKKFEQIDYTDAEYAEEIDRIRERFTPLVKICQEYGTAMRIGTNHGSLSDRIMSRYGDTPMGMVESAMEFLRIARGESYHNIVLSMKASNPQVMVQAYRLLIQQMEGEFGECYPLHLGVTEAGDGEDGRVKSAVGIGTLLEDGIGDTIRVSLTEDPELEIPVCRDLAKRYSVECQQSTANNAAATSVNLHPSTVKPVPLIDKPPYSPFQYAKRKSFAIDNMGSHHVPVVIADLSKQKSITPASLESIGYTYHEASDKWNISDAAADYIFTATKPVGFALPGTLKIISYYDAWKAAANKTKCFPIVDADKYLDANTTLSETLNFVMVDCYSGSYPQPHLETLFAKLKTDATAIISLFSTNKNNMQSIRRMFMELELQGIQNPVIIIIDSNWQTPDEHLIHYATEAGALLLDGFGDGICFGMTGDSYKLQDAGFKNTEGRNYSSNASPEQFINSTTFSILQATRTRISKTEYISCPSCGRTLFDLQETTAKIRSVTNHLKGVKIAIMGCIVNGPGEMADADFGYVGSGVDKITLYKGKEVVKKNIESNIAVAELINLLKESEAWVEPLVSAN
ncbi:(E)-4-hydroxy-3-methylbut-2-enyl-diphosphate synthase [Parasediminibacterium sp. JCM 36343]|uniref:(E)-4-hydroxy-3-methylbut-2-enyl-diphosphate synthase n=1 Tax=Parasediminibacterium sp. JCM 36343 TaxID=3374279 RepID=UPI00397AFBBD